MKAIVFIDDERIEIGEKDNLCAGRIELSV
jgi:hypothetical protein